MGVTGENAELAGGEGGERVPGGAVRGWFWLPLASLTIVAFTAVRLGWGEAWGEFWGVAAAVEVTVVAVSVLAGFAVRRCLLRARGAAVVGVAVTVFSYFLVGPVLVAGQELLEAVGWFASEDQDVAERLIGGSLVIGVFGLLLTGWLALPAGALAGMAAWRATGRRLRGISARSRTAAAGRDGTRRP